MPVAEFTLDSRFDFQAIETASILARELVSVYTKPPSLSVELSLKKNVVDVPEMKISRKRALEADVFERPRIVKRARICAPERPLRTSLKLKSLMSKRFLPTCTSSPIDEEIGASTLEELQVVDESFERDKDTAPLSTILPHPNIVELRAYWEDQLDEQAQNSSVLSLCIKDLLQAPGSHATLFSIGGEYLGKPFRVISESRDNRSTRTGSPFDVSKTLIETPCIFNTWSKPDREGDDRIRNERIPSLKIRNSSGWLKLGKAKKRFPVLIDN